MDSPNGQEEIARLKKSNERLTLLCIVLAVIAIAAGLYARIQKSIADENFRIAAIEAKHAAEEKQKARLTAEEALQQRKIAEALTVELALIKGKFRHTK